jgi:hypothetical protein
MTNFRLSLRQSERSCLALFAALLDRAQDRLPPFICRAQGEQRGTKRGRGGERGREEEEVGSRQTHTHTHTQRERERDKREERDKGQTG